MSNDDELQIKAAIDAAASRAGYDPSTLNTILSSPPFLTVEGVINLRDIGGVRVPVSPPDDVGKEAKTQYYFKPATFFRSGELTRISPNGLAKLRDELHIRAIFDLRSKQELERWKSQTPGMGIGKSGEVGDGEIKVVRMSVADEDSEEFDPAVLAGMIQKFETNEQEAFAKTYFDILTKGAPAFETILRHLRDKPDEPCLVHCTAGKDRTGLIAAIVLSLLGAPDEAIIKDYTLTTAGLLPAMPFLVARFKKEPAYNGNWKGVENMGSARESTMRATLQMIREKFGGAEGYVKKYMSMMDEDIKTIRRNLAVKDLQ